MRDEYRRVVVEDKCNIWTKHVQGEWVCITTNNFIKANGEAVMGRGVARQAAIRFPGLAAELGGMIKVACAKSKSRPGSHNLQAVTLHVFEERRLIAFPTKFAWWEVSSIELIRQSAIQLMSKLQELSVERIYLPRPGCANGKLLWGDVKVVLEDVLDERVIVVDYK